jgi:hypothetical protein
VRKVDAGGGCDVGEFNGRRRTVSRPREECRERRNQQAEQ